MNDFRYAFRVLAKSPGFTAVVVLSLGLGIGANATVLSWIENLLLRPLPGVVDQKRLVVINSSQRDRMSDTVSLLDIREMLKMNEIFAGVSGSQQTPACLSADGKAEWLYGQIVTANFFEVMGVKTILGRTFLPEEDDGPGKHPVVVIGEPLWRKRFGADPSMIGKTIVLNENVFTVIGIAPSSFQGDIPVLRCDFWAPAMMHREIAYPGVNPNQIMRREARWLHTYGRLQPGVSIQQARAAMETLAKQLEQTYPDANRNIRFHASPLWNPPYGAQKMLLPVLGLLLVVSMGVLLIIIANVANMLLARATSRRKEISIRLAMGAGRGRLTRQLLIESLVLALIAGVIGAMFAHWMVKLFVVFLPKTPLPIELALAVDGRTLVATMVLTLLTGAMFGLIPSLQASRVPLNDVLKENTRGAAGTSAHKRLRNALVVSEMALASVLVVSALLCIKGLNRGRNVDLGLDPNGVLIGGMRIGMNGYSRETAPEFYRAALERIAQIPGVQHAAWASWFPLGLEDMGKSNIEIPGEAERTGDKTTLRAATVSGDYFATMSIRVVAGRTFDQRDSANSTLVTIINDAMAQRFWPGQEVLGRTFKVNGRDRVVVGVVKTGKYRARNERPEGFLYLPHTQSAGTLDLGFCVRTKSLDPLSMINPIRQAIRSVDPRVEVWQALAFNDYMAAAATSETIASNLLVFLGSIIVVLAAMGVYAVMAYTVSQRTQEFGVRIALGATPRNLIWFVVRKSLILAAIGSVIGLALASGVTRLLAGFLYGVSPFDPLTFALAPILLSAAAVVASWIPAMRATSVDPVVALRAE